ncbi:lipid A-modifier LpxR family protein [Brevundimonas fluminis]|uniref:lipid A-modifier LpxR family protein n=1 Tax=Brevundimonas fluminis TaxID=2487274 RepID=UPI000F657576|nr:lipid A-modifier LpxR family protein [Brevundimonas fluminis]
MRWTEAGRRIAGGTVTAALCLVAGAAAAQTSIRQTWGDGTDATSRLNRAAPAAALASSSGFSDPGPSATRVMAQPDSPWVAVQRDVWVEGEGATDRFRLTRSGQMQRVDGSPLPPGPMDAAMLDSEAFDLSYTRGWPTAIARTESGLEVSLTPHAGIGLGSRGGSAEAGATLKIGNDLERMVPDGSEAFGDRPRWYVYAAGSGRAVGYNFARTRDGGFARSGVSHDSGAFIGDASLGVAMRQGPVHGSVGLVYREVEVEGMRLGEGVDTDVSEGLFAFQLSIKPEW